MSLLVVGSVAFDCVETPFGKRDTVLGGSASFFSTAASFFGPVKVVGVVGEDFPQEHFAFFQSRQIDTSGIRVLPGKTFLWRGSYSENPNVAHTHETQLNVYESFQPDLPQAYRGASHVVLGNIDPVLQMRVLDQVSRPELVIADTMNFWIEGSNADLKRVLARVDLLCINDGEARQLSGEYNLVKAAETIRAIGPRILVVKRGEHGVMLFSDEGLFLAPAFPLQIIRDPTGAGDSFAGGMVGFLHRSGKHDADTLRRAVVMGSVIASFAVEDFSLDRFRALSRAEIQARFEEFSQLTRFDGGLEGFWD